MNMTRGADKAWEIEISDDELTQIFAVAMAIGRRETASTVVWLTRVPNGPRLWIFREGTMVTWVTARAAQTDPVIAVPIPEPFLGMLSMAAGDDDSIKVSCNLLDGTIVGRTSTRSIATDMPTDAEFMPVDLPYQRHDASRHRNPAIATVPLRDLVYLATMAHDIPRGLGANENLRVEERMYPYVSVAVGEGKMTWTRDWRRYGMGRTTASISAITTGSVTAMFYPHHVARVLFTKDPDQDVRMFIDGPEAEYAYIVGDDWGIRVGKQFEEVMRWRKSLAEAIESGGYELAVVPGHVPNNKVAFLVSGSPCFARIMVTDDGQSEKIRLTTTVASDVEPTLESLTRIDELNLQVLGARVALRDGEVCIECEFPAADLPNIGPHLATFASAVTQVGPLFEFLPLFAAATSGD